MIREKITDRAHGIDVSHHQGEFILDKTWGQIDFAIAKFGEGYNTPYSEPYDEAGNLEDFLPLWNDGCAQVPIRGVYFYQRSGYSWQRQAGTFLERLEKLNVKPHMIWCDVEKGGNVIGESFLADTKRIMDFWRFNAPQYTTGLYTNKDVLQNYILPMGKRFHGAEWIAQMKEYPLWFAQYWFIKSPNKQPGTVGEWSNWDLWQYSESADSFEIRDGVRMRHYGSPDVNVYNGTPAEMRTWLKIPDDSSNSPLPEAPATPKPGKVTLIVPKGQEVEVKEAE